MPMTPSCQSSFQRTYPRRARSAREAPRQRGRLSQDPVLDRLPVAVQLLELGRELLRALGVVGEDQLERDVGAAEPAGGVDARCEAEADGGRVDRRRVDVRAPHECLQSGPARAGERP